MSHNRQVDALLAEIQEIAERARAEKDFDPIYPRLRRFLDMVGPIRYDNTVKWEVLIVTAVLGVAFALAYFLRPDIQYQLDVWGYVILGGFACAIITILVLIGTAQAGIDQVSDLIFEKDVFFDNRLEEQSIAGQKVDLYKMYRKEFGEFRHRGDKGRRIARLVHGAGQGWGGDVPFGFYVFRYARVYHVPVTRKIGKTTYTTMERRTENLYRRGLILEFPFLNGFAAVSDGGSYDYPEEFEPASPEFNDVFRVTASSAQDAAAFLNPAIVQAFLHLARHFSGLNIEINREGRMNIAFDDDDVLDLERKSSISEPDEFEAEIRSHLALPKLRLLLEFVETLRRNREGAPYR